MGIPEEAELLRSEHGHPGRGGVMRSEHGHPGRGGVTASTTVFCRRLLISFCMTSVVFTG